MTSRPLPAWYDGAKLGLLIHYGPYTVPGWAERRGTMQELWQEHGPGYFFKHNPYPEWYLNTISIPGSPAREHHDQTYGRDFSYESFIPLFEKAVAKLDVDAWAGLFADSGAKYVLLTTKHHDGYCLWPSRHRLPDRPEYYSGRDIVGDLTEAVRGRGLRMGLYYSGGYDKLFNDTVIRGVVSGIDAVPQDQEYADYANAQVRELIERYEPSVLWNDIAWPPGSDLDALIDHYYEAVPDGVVNDRWPQFRLPDGFRRALFKIGANVYEKAWPLLPRSRRELTVQPGRARYDFRTPEYAVRTDISEEKWETARGLGMSFGYNREEGDEDMLSATELIHMLVDIVSKNGNLLLGVAPAADGTLSEGQTSRLRALGDWLKVNGEAIYGTRPWMRAEGTTADGVAVRYTRGDDALYAILLGSPRGEVVLESIAPELASSVRLLSHDGDLEWSSAGGTIRVALPHLPTEPALTLRIAVQPRA